jgi:hypothetical protein
MGERLAHRQAMPAVDHGFRAAAQTKHEAAWPGIGERGDRGGEDRGRAGVHRRHRDTDAHALGAVEQHAGQSQSVNMSGIGEPNILVAN